MGAVEDEVRIGRTRPALRCLVDLISERADAGGQRHVARVEETGLAIAHLPIESGRRDRGVGEPVERHVVEDVFAGQALLRAVKYPSDEVVALDIMVEHPRCETDW